MPIDIVVYTLIAIAFIAAIILNLYWVLTDPDSIVWRLQQEEDYEQYG